MNTFLDVLQERAMGKWCRIGAWLIVAVFLFNILVNLLRFSVDVNAGTNAVTWFQLLLQTLPSIIFYFFALYGLGVLVDHMTIKRKDNFSALRDGESVGRETDMKSGSR